MRTIEDYALIGNEHSAALVGTHGAMDWLCLPRFDSPSCFAALLDDQNGGRWTIRPVDGITKLTRGYLEDSLVLETTMHSEGGSFSIIDFMPRNAGVMAVIRLVRCLSGNPEIFSEIDLRFEYGLVEPWIKQREGGFVAIAGPNAVYLYSSAPFERKNSRMRMKISLHAGQVLPMVLVWQASHLDEPHQIDADQELTANLAFWRDWVSRIQYNGPWRNQVVRSLITLKSLIYSPTGGIVAAPTSSLPESIGADRNWDYRFCWLRDATYTLNALMLAGYTDEAQAWRNWLLRTIAGSPAKLQVLYGIHGERRTEEQTIPWLKGFRNSGPVRIGNAASSQRQWDIYGEILDALHLGRKSGLSMLDHGWQIEREIAHFINDHWQEPDHGIWEIRSDERHFVHSKVMAWVALDRAVKTAEQFNLDGRSVAKWKTTLKAIRSSVLDRGYNEQSGVFVQAYDSKEVDSSLLLLPLVGFISANDARMVRTVAAIEDQLMGHGFLRRYHTRSGIDGMSSDEGAFLACSFWYVDNLMLQGRQAEARHIFSRLISVANDVGLLAEEYDPVQRRLVGNFPQAYSHVGVICTAFNLSRNSHTKNKSMSRG